MGGSERRGGASGTGRGRRAVAISYHFLRAPGRGRFRLRAHETPERFADQLARLSERFHSCRVGELLDPDSDLPETSVALTFDDGAKDVIREALPRLARAGATASVFVCAQPYLEGRLLEIQKIEFLMQALGLARFRAAFYAELERRHPQGVAREPLDFAGGYRFYRYDDESVRRFKLDLNYQLPTTSVVPVLDALFAGTFGAGSEAEAVRETYLDLDDLKRLADAGLEIGVHTFRHRVLPRLDFEEQRREIEVGADFVRRVTGEARPAVAYPYGFRDARTERVMRELDLAGGLTMERRTIGPEDLRHRFGLPRYDVNDCFDRTSNEPCPEVFAALGA